MTIDKKSGALFWHKERNGVRCDLCAWRCFVAGNKLGYCQVRKNVDNRLYSLNYSKVASFGLARIENNPLYHFYPSSKTFFIHTVGSSFRLDFKKIDVKGKEVSAGKMLDEIKSSKAYSVTFGGGEPIVEMEYVLELMRSNKKLGIANILVTNGYTTSDINKTINKFLDAVTIEVYGSLDVDFYKKHCSVDGTKPLKAFMKQMKKHRIHMEISNFIIPKIGDDVKTFKRFVDFIVSDVDAYTPLHLTLANPAATKSTKYFLEEFHKEAVDGGIRYVFTKGIPGKEDTICYNCSNVLIKRSDGLVKEISLIGDRCPGCGLRANLINK